MPKPQSAPLARAIESETARWQKILRAQIALVRHGISPGSVDGVLGSQTRAALRIFQRQTGLPTTGEIDTATMERLDNAEQPFSQYLITQEDVSRLRPLGRTWLEKSQQDRLEYETILELVAEKARSHPHLIERLNPSLDWTHLSTGTAVNVPNTDSPPATAKAAYLKISIGGRVLEAFDSENNLLLHFPCSIAQRVEKRPIGEE
ncbi:MAG TPA: peptidoglycan-binding domain-containing protein, partial [Verrucomicrobiae bacterium]